MQGRSWRSAHYPLAVDTLTSPCWLSTLLQPWGLRRDERRGREVEGSLSRNRRNRVATIRRKITPAASPTCCLKYCTTKLGPPCHWAASSSVASASLRRRRSPGTAVGHGQVAWRWAVYSLLESHSKLPLYLHHIISLIPAACPGHPPLHMHLAEPHT